MTATVSAAAALRAPEDIVITGTGAERFVTDLATGRVFVVNATAALLVERARAPATVDDFTHALRDAYPDVPADEIARDARDVADELARLGVLVPVAH